MIVGFHGTQSLTLYDQSLILNFIENIEEKIMSSYKIEKRGLSPRLHVVFLIRNTWLKLGK